MPTLLSRYATPLITGLFLVSLVSGVALFFHLGQAWFHSMHEWLSMVLILPFVLHLWKNWRPVTSYLKRAPMWIALAASVVLAALFVVPMGTGGNGGGGRPPQFAFAEQMMAGTPAEIAAVLDVEPATLQGALAAQGFDSAAGATLSEIAANAGRGSSEVMSAVLSAAPQTR